jgi:succinoglycan biosynthesis transport protein ExoP
MERLDQMSSRPNRTEVDHPEMIETGPNVDLLAAVWRRKWTVACVAVIALGLGYLYFLKAQPIYQSTAQMLLVKRQAELPIAAVEQRGGYEDTLSTHMLVLTSPLIVGRAVEAHDLASLPSLQGAGDVAAAIIGGLSAARAGNRDARDPNVIVLNYEGPSAEDCGKVLDAVVSSYRDFLSETYEDFSEDTVQLIAQAKDSLHKQLTEKEAAYRRFRQEAPLLWKGAEGANLHEMRVAQIEDARSQVLLANAQTRARIDAIETALQEGGNRAALTLLVNKANSGDAAGGALGAFEAQLFSSLLEEQMLLETYGSEHPKVIAVRKKMGLIREYMQDQPQPDDDQPADFLTVYLESLRQDLKIGEEKQRQYDELFASEREAAKMLASTQLADETFRSEIDRTQRLFDGVVKRLEEINLVKDYGGISMELISPPGVGRQIQPKLALVLTIAGVMGLLSGLVLGYVVDVADRSFRSPDDIRRQLGLPLVGHIPVIGGRDAASSRGGGKSAGAALHPVLCTFHRPKGRYAEAYRAVRTSLYFSTHGGDHKVIQVTSPDSGDGKTTLAGNLAVSIAQSGKRILLIDADFRRPQVHKYFGVDNSKGMSSVITGEAKLFETIRQTPVEHLSVLPCGPRPHNPAELLTSPRLKELLDTVREKFDFVIVDSPPLLVVTDPAAVAPRVDAVLLVMRLKRTARDGMARAAEILDSLGANVLGVVVNAVGKTAGYGYGSYRYGYGYGYGYRYGYGNDNVYYTDEAPDPRPVGNHSAASRGEQEAAGNLENSAG